MDVFCSRQNERRCNSAMLGTRARRDNASDRDRQPQAEDDAAFESGAQLERAFEMIAIMLQ